MSKLFFIFCQPLYFLVSSNSIRCWVCSNNPHDGHNPCPDDLSSRNVHTELCPLGSCQLKFGRRGSESLFVKNIFYLIKRFWIKCLFQPFSLIDGGTLRPIKATCVSSEAERILPGGSCMSGLGLILFTGRQYSTKYCTVICSSDLCTLRLARKFV